MNKIITTLIILALLTLAACATQTTTQQECTIENGCIIEEPLNEGPINTTTTTVTINITGEPQ